MFPKISSTLIVLVTALFFNVTVAQISVSTAESPANINLDRKRGLSMLDDIKEALETHYYDKTFHGINLDERFKLAKERVKTLNSNARIFRAIAQVLFEFKDSHTRFLPPLRANRVEYGFSFQMVGNNCFVVDVKKRERC
jgi:Tricorn protease C1 domain